VLRFLIKLASRKKSEHTNLCQGATFVLHVAKKKKSRVGGLVFGVRHCQYSRQGGRQTKGHPLKPPEHSRTKKRAIVRVSQTHSSRAVQSLSSSLDLVSCPWKRDRPREEERYRHLFIRSTGGKKPGQRIDKILGAVSRQSV